MTSIAGTQVNQYRYKPPGGVFTAFVTYTGGPIYINNSSGVADFWQFELKQTFTPSNSLYQPYTTTIPIPVLVQPTTQFSLNTLILAPSPFASGVVNVTVNVGESPAYTGAGTRAFTGTITLRDASGNVVVSSAITLTYGLGQLTGSFTAPRLFDNNPAHRGSVDLTVNGSVSGTAINNNASISAASVWGPPVAVPTLSTQTPTASGTGSSRLISCQVNTTGGILTSEMAVTAEVQFWAGPPPFGSMISDSFLPMTFNAVSGKWEVNSGTAPFPGSYLVVTVTATDSPHQQSVTPSSSAQTNLGPVS